MRLRVLPLWSNARRRRGMGSRLQDRARPDEARPQAVLRAIILQARARASVKVRSFWCPLSRTNRDEQQAILLQQAAGTMPGVADGGTLLLQEGQQVADVSDEAGTLPRGRADSTSSRASGASGGRGDLVMAARGELVVVVAARRAAAPRGPLRLLRLQRWAQHRRRRLVRAGR